MTYPPHALLNYRTQNNLTRAELAARLGMAEQWVADVEERKHIPSEKERDAILKATGIRSIDWNMSYQPMERMRVIPPRQP